MGFYLRDLHLEIEQKYLKAKPTEKLTAYRGQGLSNADFEKLKNSEGGLISFNSFLSTSLNQEVARMYAESANQDRNTMGVIFQIEIDPSITSVPYVNLNDIGARVGNEEEIFFSMHTVFQIGNKEYPKMIQIRHMSHKRTVLQSAVS